ncbi:MAG: prepilin peptidase [Allosphingosinicella sp.]|uniref:A24 family peptidase n=1 Tax=Allosphingosinicella sp. TaxID=2823234 RepID=UPI00392DC4C6
MNWGLAEILLALLASLLLLAAVLDLRSRTIPNPLNLAIALLAVPFWWATGLSLWPDAALQLALGAGVFMLFALAFRIGWMGGGDVKMLAAIALWLPPQALMVLLLVMSLAGGALTVAMMIRKRIARAEGAVQVPYGVAIAFGGLWLIGERILNQFG